VIYLLDTSGLVRLLRDPGLQTAWYEAIDAEAIGSCYPQRTEFLYSARNASECDEIAEMFAAAQHQMARAGEHRSASAVDLIIAATAPHHGLTVLHEDADYRTVARHAPDLTEQCVRDVS
jgi:predicted nucleic acid-binding protein